MANQGNKETGNEKAKGATAGAQTEPQGQRNQDIEQNRNPQGKQPGGQARQDTDFDSPNDISGSDTPMSNRTRSGKDTF